MANLAVIPARGGSKRLPGKNVRLLAGEPLIAYSIRAALESGVFDLVVVSTDDPAIAAVAVEHGASVPFLRDASLADDHNPVSAATLDAVRRLAADGLRFEAVAQLMANCPLRDAVAVIESLHAFEASPFAAQVSVTSYGWLNPWWALKRAPDGAAEPLFEAELAQRSQDLPPLYCPTGAVWWAEVAALEREGTFHMPRRALFELPWSKAVDIDDEADFELAEFLMAYQRARAAGASVN